MDPDNLIRMANRIGDFFAVMPEQSEAEEGVATHLKKFWEPRMRRALRLIASGDRAGELHPLVRQAVAADQAQSSSDVPPG